MSDAWAGFWSVVWLFFVGFALVVYLIAIFTVLGDIFRDRTLNGWWKAVWILFLIFVPFLTVLVYVVTRAGGMVDRLEPRDHHHPAPPEHSPQLQPQPHATTSPATEIKNAKELVDAGVITPSEFDALKSRALGSS